MAKLYFRYGTMDSAKSMNLLAVAHNYRKQGKRVLLMKPRLDTRFGSAKIASRSGLEAEADLIGELGGTDLAGTDLVVKLGARGVRAGGTVYPAHRVDAVDPTGAGDAFAAGYLVGGVSVGLAAAARAVAKMGAMP